LAANLFTSFPKNMSKNSVRSHPTPSATIKHINWVATLSGDGTLADEAYRPSL
jgi:hypothetical protein